ncbi:hypothetical protein B0H66DRAFT_537705 [Apodospora peruviana]|uniref:Uncharacterized protein n=1 Tax=Apodospora peruviana TaxID=516989 RepID=A0AAE0HVA8_9PEZI|nr:hypothetical protein B0H66DRAFT_537705 [Apodospora peruviana]
MSLIPSATTPPMAPTFTLAAPLTTAWTLPAACTSPPPHFVQGYCDGNSCTPNKYSDTGLGTGWINQPFETGLGGLENTQCQPSGYNVLIAFAYRPATGCPSGYETAAVNSHRSETDLAVLTCCPSSYSMSAWSIYIDPIWSNTTTLVSCTSVWTLTSGQPYLGVAGSVGTDTVQYNSSGAMVTTTSTWYSEVVLSTGTITAPTTTAQINQPPLQLIVPTQSLTASSSTGTTPTTYSLFNLPFIYSIIATVGIGVGSLAVLCCLCCVMRRICRSTGSPTPRPPPVATIYPTPITPYPVIPVVTTPPSTYASSLSQASCRHNRSSMCSYKLTYETNCCACKDSRPASPSLTVQARTMTYCFPCQSHWRSCLSSQIPPEWRVVPATADDRVDEIVEQLIEERKCPHGIVGAACSRCPAGSKMCCACVDRRAGQLLSQEARAATYCTTCAEYYRDLKPDECPAGWRLAEVQCEHGRSKTCKQSKAFEASCCACKDTRRGAMPRQDRTATYCAPCASHWTSVATISKLPKSWGIKCDGHGDQFARCSTHSSRGQCCACLDKRHAGTAAITKAQRISTYCPSCISHWEQTPDSSCPRGWKLKCRHGRADAWDSTIPRIGGFFVHSPVASGGGPCCCACKDTNTNTVPKDIRLRTYCASCRALWASTPDHACPPDWRLGGCRHNNNMAARCLNAGGTARLKCCACNDQRTGNLPKTSRTKSYCATCEAVWNATPDAQCPAEWRLLENRNDCKHAMAMECGGKASAGKCCACTDGRKFLELPTRLAGYCPACRAHWQHVSKTLLPAGWLVTEKDIPIRFTKEGCLPRKPTTTYPRERTDLKYSRQFDEGPRYGAPRYGRKGEPVTFTPPINPFRRRPVSESKQSAMTQYTVQVHVPPQPAEPNYQGYEDEKGPLREGGPRFSVAPDTDTKPTRAVSVTVQPLRSKKGTMAPTPKKKCWFANNESVQRRWLLVTLRSNGARTRQIPQSSFEGLIFSLSYSQL